MNKADLLITNGIVVTMDRSETVIANGAVAVCGDRIVDIGPNEKFSDCRAAKVVDAKNGFLLPGLNYTQTHAAMTCFRGLADDLHLMTWLNDYIFPAEAKLNYEKVKTGALLACAEMILSGTTCFADMYLFEDAVAEAAKAAGMRAVVGEVLYNFPSPSYGAIEEGFVYSENLIKKWKSDPLITVAVEPHSPYLCAPDLLTRASDLSNAYEVPLIIHVAETQTEVNTIFESYGKTPIAHLADIGVLSPLLLACHCVAVTDKDIEQLASYDVKVSHNPESNMKLASGIAPVPQMMNAGICVGLGTDGCTSNNNIDMFLEMDTAAKIHKVNTLDPTVMDAKTVLKMATRDAAKALGLDGVTGSLVPGKKADIIIIDINKPHLTPMYNLYSHLVYAAGGNDVDTSVINGQVVMENRQLLTLDIEKVMADVNEIAAEVKSGF
jgi:5-methylthioadenosine/S-adenosylhomocysteine deaminase